MAARARNNALCKYRVIHYGLYDKICKALVEKDVENVYRQLFHIAFPDASITSPHTIAADTSRGVLWRTLALSGQ
jgi:hypothetical protein